MKKMKWLASLLAMCLVLVLPVNAFAEETDTQVVEVTTAEELVAVLTDTTALPVQYKNLTVEILNNIDVSEVEWVSGFVNGYCGAEVYTVNGNDNTISGLTGALFSGTWAGNGNLIINDLTIADSEMSGGADNNGFGAFIGHTEATEQVTLNNCHLLNCSVTGADWTGGLIGYAAGYNNQNDGPVFQTIDIMGCSVEGCTITGAGSTGGIIGHATGNLWTRVNIEDCVVSDNVIICTDDSDKKAGSVMGTVGVAGAEYAGKTGGVWVAADVSGNTVTSNGVEIVRIFGRFGSGGTLHIVDGDYDCFRNECVAPDSGVLNISEEAWFVLAKLDEEKIEISEELMEESIAMSGEGEAVELPVAEAAGGITTVELPVSGLQQVVESEKALVIVSETAVMEIEPAALEAIVAETDGTDTIVLVVEQIEESVLNEQQQAALEQKDVAAVISAEILHNGAPISDFGGGKINVYIPFEPAAGTNGSDYKVIYIADDGSTENIVTEYVEGYLVVELEHFSEYAIVKAAPATGDHSNVLLWVCLMVGSLLGCAIVDNKKVA